MAQLFERIAIIGLGLIGSSIARGAREKKLAAHIVGCDRNEVSLAYAKKHEFIDSSTSHPGAAVKDCQLVILATPPLALEETARAIAPKLKPGAIVMDVCSVKQAAIAAIAPQLPPEVIFMPAHPIAGSEHSGIAAGNAKLFDQKRVVVTPSEPSENDAFQNITAFWRALGAKVEAMPPHLHDLLYAYVSHLPQLLAFAAGHVLVDVSDDEHLKTFLRIARSNAEMWAEIYLLNSANMLKSLDRYLDAVMHIVSELQSAPSPSEKETAAAQTILFPRIAASCLITTVMEAEKKAGFPFARYAGGGFADFTSPAASAPEDDIENISNQYGAVKTLLEDYVTCLKELRAAIAKGDKDALEKLIRSLRT